jgi:excisionase family DNA binding protein
MELEKAISNEQAANTPLPVLLTVNQALKELGGISKSLLYELINSRQLESFTIGRRRLIPSTAIQAYVKRRLSEDFA